MSRLSTLLKPSGDYKDFHWQINTWSQLHEGAEAVRTAVFVNEQKVPAELESDEYDIEAVHILVTEKNGTPVATARMIKDDNQTSRIGRMSVIFQYRGEGLGKIMLTELMQFARRRRDKAVILNAQSHAVGFYRKYGFRMEGEPFMEANIPHIKMTINL